MAKDEPTNTSSHLAAALAPPAVSRHAIRARPRAGRTLYRLLLAGSAVAGGLLVHGFRESLLPVDAIHLFQAAAILLYWVHVVVAARRERGDDVAGPRLGWPDYLLLAVIVVGLFTHFTDFPILGWTLVELTAVCMTVIELWRFNVTLARTLRHPGVLLPLSFATLIAVGTPLLMLPVTVPLGQDISWSEALFTMTSAVCVTGLAVRDTATQFTPLGQTIVAVFIQLGGLGIIIFGSMFALLLGKSLSLRENMSLSRILNDQPLMRMAGLVRMIVIGSLLIELLGAALLYAQWDSPDPAATGDTARRIGFSLFHSISSFCNAGFDLTGNSFVAYRQAPAMHAVILPLIVIGGLGFPVLLNFYAIAAHQLGRVFAAPRRISIHVAALTSPRLTLHSKVVLMTTACVYLIGVVTLSAGQLMPYVYESFDQGVTAHAQRPDALGLEQIGGILTDASFMSISARTAGFTSLPMDEIEPAGRFTIMTLMCIGGSPGSTAGGIKTTVIALLVLSVIATIRQRRESQAFGRAIADPMVRKAATLGVCYLGLIVLATWLLRLSEPYPFEHLLFEVVSAATTTGLSLGITDGLTGFGKTIIMATMFLGRIGPLALLGALVFGPSSTPPYGYAHEDVVLG
jgi:trk system potassium uptake protein TrkH